ncbi:protein kinase domain-containing protein [Pseudofrankia asymbiotica]|uniref:non-specific serine/threonine protein kinase n=1 Tax=Pseudofrankia asymbiotica TaxID=1834516 RepID=A0A1V2IG86_9ACTN|nr:protein kinase [Pseudofrankia asymbiotica]ONH31476.1 hypothetical protein BL253_09670 [Pseudofrankia asymbiotica]
MTVDSSADTGSARDLPPNFRQLAPVGSGSAGQVYRAYDEALSRTVALKLFTGPLTDNPAALAAFRLECATLGRLSAHPGVVSVHSAGVTPSGRPWLCMQFVPGGTLSRALRRDGPLTQAEALRTGALVADTLAWAHGLTPPVLHCDVKPGNILLTGDGHPLLSDFGVSVWVASGRSSVTVKGFTQAYAAPEVLFHGRFSPRSEVWSLAATLFEMLTGTPPFEQLPGEGTGAFIERVGYGLPRDAGIGLSGPLRALLRRGLAVNREDRWPSAAAFAAAIRSAQAELGLPVTPAIPAPAPPPAHDVLVADAPAIHATPQPSLPSPAGPPSLSNGTPAGIHGPRPDGRPVHPSQEPARPDGLAGGAGAPGSAAKQPGTGPRRTVPHWWIPAAFSLAVVVALTLILVPRSRGPSSLSEPPLGASLSAGPPSSAAPTSSLLTETVPSLPPPSTQPAQPPPGPVDSAPPPPPTTGGSHSQIPSSSPGLPGPAQAVLQPGQRMGQGQKLVSGNGRFVAAMQFDGNLVVYSEGPGAVTPAWESGTGGTAASYAVMRDDGDLVLYGNDGTTVYWSSDTHGSDMYLWMRDNGELVICLEDGTVLWARRTGSG